MQKELRAEIREITTFKLILKNGKTPKRVWCVDSHFTRQKARKIGHDLRDYCFFTHVLVYS